MIKMGVRKGGYSFHNTNEKGAKKTRNVCKMYHQSAPLILDIVSVSYAYILLYPIHWTANNDIAPVV